MKKATILIVLLVIGLFAVQNRVTLDPDFEAESSSSVPAVSILSPGTQVGVTDYDWQLNGTMGRYILTSAAGGFHFYWTYQYDGAGGNRRASYNYYYPPSYWLGPTPLDARVSRMGKLAQLSDGRAVATAHANVGADIMPICYIDAAEGAGSFTIYDIPYPDPPNAPSWPSPGVDDADNIFVSGSGGAAAEWTMSTDQGANWATWSNSMGGVVLIDTFFDGGGRDFWTACNGKITMVNNAGIDHYTLHYWESIDNGASFTLDTIFNPNIGVDSVQSYIWNSAVYDNSDNLHATFCVVDTAPGAGAYGSGWRSQIWHWNEATDVISPVAAGWWETVPGPGANHPTVSENQIAINRTTGTLFCCWCQADAGDDTSSYGWTNMEIYGAFSVDNGVTWSTPENITNSHSPGGIPGECEDDRWMTIAEETHGDTVYLFYMNDKDAGSFLQGEGGAWTENPYLFYPYWFDVPGIEEHETETPSRLTMNITNPVSRNAKISYTLTNAGDISLKIYDRTGSLVRTIESGHKDAGVYNLNLDVSELANGTYFARLDTSTDDLTRTFVVIH